MIVELIDKLLDRSVALVKEIKARNSSLYENYVVPVWEAFEQVHSGYIETFKKSRELIKNLDNPFTEDSPLFDIIEEDSLFSLDQRQKLIAFVRSAKPEIVKEFIESIEDYLEVPFNEFMGNPLTAYRKRGPVMVNIARINIYGLIQINSHIALKAELPIDLDHVKRNVLMDLNWLLEQMQFKYGRVVQEYGNLKAKLLDIPSTTKT